MSKKFNITMYPQEDKTDLLFDGFIMVDENNLITGVYENSDPDVNVILPKDDGLNLPTADNIFNGFFSSNGVNFISDKIFNYYKPEPPAVNHFNLSSNFIITYRTISKKLYGTVIGSSTINSSICLTQRDLDEYTYPINVTGTSENPTVITLSSDISTLSSLTFYIAEDQYVIFNGCDYSITLSGITNYCGMFVSNSEYLKILNLNIKNDIDNPSTLDTSCGWFGNTFFSGTIEKCSSDGDLTNTLCGGIVGLYAGCGIISGYCKISNCNSSGNILGLNSGGICSGQTGNGGKFIVNNCYSTGIISGEASGGIVGYGFGVISSSFNLDNSYNVISNCYSTGDITGIDSGGIVGYDASTNIPNSTCEIKGCYSVGLIGGTGAGGIVGGYACGRPNNTLTVTNCYSIGSIEGTGAGGIVGHHCGDNGGILTLTNCYSTGNISSGTGGIVGDFAADNGGQCNISNCYTIGTTAVGGFDIVDTQYGATVTNCKHSTTGWSDTDGNTYLKPNNVWKKVSIPSITNQPWKIFSNFLSVQLLPKYQDNTLAVITLFPDSVYSNVSLTTILTDSDGNNNSDTNNGVNFNNVQYSDGDNEFYIKITAIEEGDIEQTYYKVGDYINYIQLSTINNNTTITRSNVNNYNYPIRVLGDTTITIGENIVCSSGQNIGFTVPSDQNVTITGNKTITIKDVSNYLGLVYSTSETCVVENIGVLSSDSYIYNGRGWLCTDQSKGTVRNCYSNGDISSYYSGGIVGSTFASDKTAIIDKCYSTGIISGFGCGGIAAASAGSFIGGGGKCTISDCYSTGVIAGPNSGGITGILSGGFEFGGIKGNCTISNCHSTGDIVGIESGGISGKYAGIRGNCTITDCYSNGAINGYYAGGITGSYSGDGSDASGILIRGTCIITRCYSNGNINGFGTGGISGYAAGASGDCIITDCYSTGIINGNASGGIVGILAAASFAKTVPIDSNCTITNCYSIGDVVGNNSGGIAGSEAASHDGAGIAKCNISKCYSTGNIIGMNCGGITGSEAFSECTITNCYAIGDISGKNSAGISGFESFCNITNCYTTGIKASDAFNIVDTQYGAKVTNSDHSLGWSDSIATKYLIPLNAWKKVTPTTITNQAWKLNSLLKDSEFTVDATNKTVTYKNPFPINILYKSEKLTVHLENESGTVISDSITIDISQDTIVFTNVVLMDTNMNIYIVIESVEPILLTTKAVNKGYYNSGDYMDYYYNIVPTTTSTTTSTTTEPPICYNKGTKILCLNNDLQEQYTPIENITRGMLVKTYKHGYRRVEFIGSGKLVNNINKAESCMYILPKQGNMIDNLIVTGGHSILVDKYPNENIKEHHSRVLNGSIKIDDKYLLLASLSAGILKPVVTNSTFTYYHLVLESDDEEIRYGIWANGILSESVSKKEFLKRNYNRI